MSKIWTISLFVIAIFSTVALTDEAEEWNGGLEVGATLTDGNSNTERVHFDFNYSFEWGKNEILIDSSYKYGEADDEKSIDNASAMIQYNRQITERVFGHTQARYEMDDIAELDHRLIIGLGPGLGYYLIKNEETELATEVGLAWVEEKQAGVIDNTVVFRFAERFEHKFNGSARIYQKLEYLPTTEDFSEFLLSFEVGAESGFTERTALRISLENKYNSSPEGEVEKNDLTLKGGIVFKL